jgi:hypothetical protein
LSNRLIRNVFPGEFGRLFVECIIQNVPALPQDFAHTADAKRVIDGRLALGLNLTSTRADKGRAR